MFVPKNEIGVRELFAQRCQTLGYRILDSQRGFPDYVLLDPQGQRLRAEAEFASENFILHGHDSTACDLIICWRHTQAMGVPVLELASEQIYLPGCLPPPSTDGTGRESLPQKANRETRRARQWLGPRRSYDVLSLTEWPIAIASRRDHELTVTCEDTIPMPNGTFLHRRWVIDGTSEHGLPGYLEQDIYLILMERAQEMGFAHPTMPVHLCNLCRRLGWTAGGTQLARIKKALHCLAQTSITAENAFWDHQRKAYVSKTFHLLDEVTIPEYQEGQEVRMLPLSVRWGEHVFNSIQAGYLKYLDLRFYFSLERDLARSLYRYLDKHRYDGKKVYRIGLRKLTAHLGMAPAYPAQWKQRLEPAHQELTRRGFFQNVQYEPGKEEELVVYRFGTPKPVEAPPPPDPQRPLPLQEEPVAAAWEGLTEEERAALIDAAIDRLSPALRDLNGGRRDSMWVLMEVDRLLREQLSGQPA
jgi:hypothetical protein